MCLQLVVQRAVSHGIINVFRCRKLASSYPKLVHFEICVLANLAPGDPEEAKLMIPSLAVCWVVVLGDSSVADMFTMCVVPQGKVTPEDLAQIVEEVALYR